MGDMRRGVWLVGAVLGCGGGSGVPPALDAPPAAADAPVRTLRLASSAARLDPALGPVLDDPDVAGDVDVVAVQLDFYGVPWNELAAAEEPPRAWAERIAALADGVRATGKDVFLAVTPLGSDRAHLAPIVGGDGALDPAWKPGCYDLASAADGPALRAAYARYVEYLVGLFHPRWINFAIEVSLYHVACPGAWDGIVALERDAYDAAKRAAPDAPAFPSIQLDVLYGRFACPMGKTPDECYETEYAALAGLERDRFAVTTFPYDFIFDRPDQIPPDWLTRAAARGGERVVIAETGWLATDLVAIGEDGLCRTYLAQTPEEQADYFDRITADALAADVELVTWISNRDFVPAAAMTECPCQFAPTTWCTLIDFVRGQASTPAGKRDAEITFKTFGTMGIRDRDGGPRQPIFDRWSALRARPLAR